MTEKLVTTMGIFLTRERATSKKIPAQSAKHAREKSVRRALEEQTLIECCVYYQSGPVFD